MSTFLQELATRLLTDHTNDLSQLVMMFPSLRARVFFNDALQQRSTTPIWQPRYTTIDEIMERGSGLIRGERIRLISELFKIYTQWFPSEGFDRFYFWGDMLISDFDMIDKYMVDAQMLLRNIEDIKEIESDVSYITPEQERIITKFWSSIHTGESLSEQKRRFLEVWRSLPSIYEAYRTRLKELGIGYLGLLYRTTAERIMRGEEIALEPKRYIVAGFNALSKSERVLFDYIAKSNHGAEFYWDYDNYYVNNPEHEAGLFMRDNIRRYNTTEPLSHDNFHKQSKHLTATACVSNIAQVKHIGSILESLPAEELNKDTAIVLTDESLLIPLMHSLPSSVGKVNITMGYPLKHTLIYSFIELLTALQTHSHPSKGEVAKFYHKDVTWVLTHPFIVDCCGERAKAYCDTILSKRMTTVEETLFSDDEVLSRIFVKTNEWQSLSRYMIDVIECIMQHLPAEELMQQEHLHIAAEEIAKATRSIEWCDITIPLEVFISFLRRHLQTVTIPYEGEPLEGIQILGILETRNVDFKNVIILSMTDANFPGNHTDQSSFIPYSLRLAYDMPTPEEHEAMYAYYFYRLVQRAERVNMLYCSRADEKSTGECSRYIYQLDFESPYSINRCSVGVDLSVEEVKPIVIPKGEIEMTRLMRYTDPNTNNRLSPTALFRYVECPLKFYFTSIAHLKSNDELTDKIDALTFGNILHNTMEELYRPLEGKQNPMKEITALRNEATIERAVDKTIANILFNDKEVTTSDFTGDTLLVRDIIVKYILRGIMRYDTSRDGFTINKVEGDILYDHPIASNKSVMFTGRADRIDTLPDGSLQIIDYKSGNKPHLEYADIESLFHGKAEQRISNIFQTFLYSMMLHKTRNVETVPSLFYASKMLNKEYSPLIREMANDGCTIDKYSLIAEEFERELTTTLTELFDPAVPFTQVEDSNACKYCDFNRICRR